jgi:hypothetical protein
MAEVASAKRPAEESLDAPRKRFKAAELPITQAQRSAVDSILHAFKKKGEFDARRKATYAKFEESDAKDNLVNAMTDLAERELERDPMLLAKDRRQAAPLIEGKAERTDVYKMAMLAVEAHIESCLDGVEEKMRDIRRKEIGVEAAAEEQKRGAKSDEDYAEESRARKAVWARQREEEEEEKRKAEESLRRQQEAEAERQRQEAEKEKRRQQEKEREMEEYRELKKRQDAEWEAERLEQEAKDNAKKEKEREKAIEEAALDELIREGKRMAAKSARLEPTVETTKTAPVPTGSRKESVLATIMRAEKMAMENGATPVPGSEHESEEQVVTLPPRKQPILKFGHAGSSVAQPGLDKYAASKEPAHYDKRGGGYGYEGSHKSSSGYYDDRSRSKHYYDDSGYQQSGHDYRNEAYNRDAPHGKYDERYEQDDRRKHDERHERDDRYRSDRYEARDNHYERRSSIADDRHSLDERYNREKNSYDSKTRDRRESSAKHGGDSSYEKPGLIKHESSSIKLEGKSMPPLTPRATRNGRDDSAERASDRHMRERTPRRDSYHESTSHRERKTSPAKYRKRSRSREREGIDRYVPGKSSSSRRDEPRASTRDRDRDHDASKYKERERDYERSSSHRDSRYPARDYEDRTHDDRRHRSSRHDEEYYKEGRTYMAPRSEHKHLDYADPSERSRKDPVDEDRSRPRGE